MGREELAEESKSTNFDHLEDGHEKPITDKDLGSEHNRVGSETMFWV